MTRIVGARVRSLRESKNWTQGQLAYKAQTTDGQISRIENNDRPGAQAVIVGRLAMALGTTTDYLLGNTDNPAPVAKPSDNNTLDPELVAIADELIDIWYDLKELDPESAERLTRIAVLQSEMVLAAAKSREKTENQGEDITETNPSPCP